MAAKVEEIYRIIPSIIKLPSKIWIDYDREADVLYISFKKPQGAIDSELLEDNVLIRYKDDEIVGVTIIGVEDFIKSKKR
jgi:uncharacterized protein YuzE